MRTDAANSACTSVSESAPPSPSAAMRSCAGGVRTSGNDINVLAAPHYREGFELEPPVRRAFAGCDVVFVAVPRADEMRLGLREAVTVPGAVGRQHVLD